MSHKESKERGRPIVSGFIWLTLGLILLFYQIDAIQLTWPLLIILVGVALICGSIFKKSHHGDDAPSTSPPPPPPPSV